MGIKQFFKSSPGLLSQFMFVLRRARAGELDCEGLNNMAKLTEVNVDEVGVGGAKDFFEAKVNAHSIFNNPHTCNSALILFRSLRPLDLFD
jgi:hypothetical protein